MYPSDNNNQTPNQNNNNNNSQAKTEVAFYSAGQPQTNAFNPHDGHTQVAGYPPQPAAGQPNRTPNYGSYAQSPNIVSNYQASPQNNYQGRPQNNYQPNPAYPPPAGWNNPQASYPGYPVTQPAPKKGNGVLIVSLVGIFALLVVAVVAAIYFIGSPKPSNSNALASGDQIPVYSAATKLELDESDQDLVGSQVVSSSKGVLKNPEIAIFRISSQDNNAALNFYQQEMSKAGWTALGRQNSGTLQGSVYFKGQRAVVVAISGPVTQSDLRGAPASVQDNLKIGDRMLIVVAGDYDATKVTPRGEV